MSDASQFPITTPYGQVPGYPLNNGFHNGIDYGAPSGTDVIVNGVVIGKVGSTGYATGPHLHVGRWVGGTVTNPGVGGGFHFDNAIVTQVASDATNGNYVRIQADGASWVYLHLSQQLVSVGQVLQGGSNMAGIPDQDNWYWRFSRLMQQIRGRGLSREEFQQNFVNVEPFHMVEILSDDDEANRTQNAQEIGQLALQDQWQNQIYGLQAQLKQTTDKLTEVSDKAALSDKLQKQVDDLVAKNQALETQAGSDKQAGDSFLRRLGQFIAKYLPGGK